jgi:Amt family ammonium transporter
MALNGALAGLVAITAEPLTPEPIMATIIGAIGGLLVVGSIVTLDKLKIDDPVGAISVHGVVGIWGLLAVCLTNDEASLIAQIKGIFSIFLWVFLASLAVWFLLKKLVPAQENRRHQGFGGRGVRRRRYWGMWAGGLS